MKSLDDSAGEGVFSGYASTFGNKDLQGDVIAKGAFAETLAKDYDGGAGIPIHWNHQDGKPTDIIGRTLSAVEDEKGLPSSTSRIIRPHSRLTTCSRMAGFIR